MNNKERALQLLMAHPEGLTAQQFESLGIVRGSLTRAMQDLRADGHVISESLEGLAKTWALQKHEPTNTLQSTASAKLSDTSMIDDLILGFNRKIEMLEYAKQLIGEAQS